MNTWYPGWWKIKTPFEKILTLVSYILLLGVAIAMRRHFVLEQLGMALLVFLVVPITVTSALAYRREQNKPFVIYFAIISLLALIVSVASVVSLVLG